MLGAKLCSMFLQLLFPGVHILESGGLRLQSFFHSRVKFCQATRAKVVNGLGGLSAVLEGGSQTAA